MGEVETLREALSEIGKISRKAYRSGGGYYVDHESGTAGVCTPKALPTNLQLRAARTAADVNPMNAPAMPYQLADDARFAPLLSDPQNITLMTTKYWGTARRQLTVSFMEPTPADLRDRILAHCNAWQCGIQFVLTSGTGQVRISREGDGFWSYLGTDVLHIATDRPTMNLQGFTMSTRDSEFVRVIRHEAGHTLGFPHEHMRAELVSRVDPARAYDYFARTQGWSRSMVDQQVLTPLDKGTIVGTAADQTSIMCYQLPAEITRDHQPILGGIDINVTDRTFGQRIYPPATGSTSQPGSGCTCGAAAARVGTIDYSAAFVEEPVFLG